MISVEINNSKTSVIIPSESDVAPEHINKLKEIDKLLTEDGYVEFKSSINYQRSVLFSLYKDMSKELFINTTCNEIIPDDNMTSNVIIDNKPLDLSNISPIIASVLRNMDYRVNNRVKDFPEKIVYNDMWMIYINFMPTIIKKDNIMLLLSESDNMTMLALKSMYKNPEKFADIIFGSLPPNPNFDFYNFAKPEFVNYANKLNNLGLQESIIMGNLIKYCYMLLILPNIMSYSNCVTINIINEYLYKYKSKSININNKIDNNNLQIDIDNVILNSNIFIQEITQSQEEISQYIPTDIPKPTTVTPFIESQQMLPIPPVSSQQMLPNPPVSSLPIIIKKPKKEDSKLLFIILCVVCIVIIIISVGLFFYLNRNKKK